MVKIITRLHLLPLSPSTSILQLLLSSYSSSCSSSSCYYYYFFALIKQLTLRFFTFQVFIFLSFNTPLFLCFRSFLSRLDFPPYELPCLRGCFDAMGIFTCYTW